MAMTKAEKAHVEKLEIGIKLAKAMRWPEYNQPAPMTYDEIRASLVKGGQRYGQPEMVARGWFGSTNYRSVSYGCSNGTNCNGNGDTTCSQGMGRMFRAESDAWRDIRCRLTREFAMQLADVDAKLADAIEREALPHLRTEPASPSQETDRG